MSKVHLTKSRFKIGLACATKLHFNDNKDYGNLKAEDTFMQALAEGGFQVGELAKLYYPGGVDIETLDKNLALEQTAKLLKNDTAIIYEAAIAFENLFIRADILIKDANGIHIIEVKAKSYDPTEENQFFTKASVKKGVKKISSSWEPYLVDIAFQCHVVEKAMPNTRVSGSLMLADKSVTASVDGLNQNFFLKKDKNGRSSVSVKAGLSKADLGRQLLVHVPVDEEIAIIRASSFESGGQLLPFEKLVAFLSQTCETGSYVKPVIGTHCKACEFRIGKDQKAKGLKSGFEKCWTDSLNLKPSDYERDFVFDIWNFRKASELISAGTAFLDMVEESDINPGSKPNQKGLSSSERQWLQVQKVKQKDTTPYLDVESLSRESLTWTYPLHFIDFETTMVAIPFHAGRRPYEQIAFQFSHHQVERDGSVAHKDEYISRVKGEFPNFDFVRALMQALNKDDGTIFRFAAHENTVLCQIRQQLVDLKKRVPDHDQLVAFIDTITSSSDAGGTPVVGDRCMIDLCELVKRYYYDPQMKGSNSIKRVLPAILNGSAYLQAKYSSAIYGTKNLPSINFKEWAWVRLDANGKVTDPYKLLPPVFVDIDPLVVESRIADDNIADGGAAMTAFARMQFTEMSADESTRVQNALLKYCELDTFAMVLIWEYWNQEITKATKL